jgi:hypothetical protein
MEAYTLIAVKPKLKKADPSNRVGIDHIEEKPTDN